MKLYELSAQYKSLEALDTSEDLPAEVIRDTLEALQGDIQEKCKAVAMYIRNLQSVRDEILTAAMEMRQRAERYNTRSESLQAYLKLHMQACGITKIESPYFTLELKKNPPAVVIDHEASIPEKFWRQPEAPPKVIDRKAIAAAIKAGEEVPGCHTSSGERLEIKL